ncbi:MAG: ATP-binding cassette domain-containing protein, partial [Oscillospiraceae bacterium]|nr:ATP-binding cassette domain-containing protein [Oscillospiraceae bacterium]
MLEVRDITVRYGKTAVLDSFSVTVNEGEWLMMAGPNGAGKSTALGAIACSIPCSGT